MAKYVVYTSKGVRTKELDTLNDAKKNALGLAMASTDLVTIAYGNNPFATMKRDSKGIKYTSIATKQSHYLDVPGASKATAPKATVAKKTVAKAPVKKAVKKVETGKFYFGDVNGWETDGTPIVTKSPMYTTLEEVRKAILDKHKGKSHLHEYVFKDKPAWDNRIGTVYKYTNSPNPMWSAEDRKTVVPLNPDGTILRKEYVRKTPKPVGPQHDVKVGTIFTVMWGYDQTNRNYYQVVSVTDSGVYVRPIASTIVSSDGYGSDLVKPVKGAFKKSYDPFVTDSPKGEFKRIQFDKNYRTGEIVKTSPYIKLGTHYGHIWDGKPQHETSLGWGH